MQTLRLACCALFSVMMLNACGDQSAGTPSETLKAMDGAVPALNSLEDSLSYHSGWLVSQDIKANVFEVDLDLYLRGLARGMNEGERPLNDEEVQRMLEVLEEREIDRIRTLQRQKAENAKQAGVKFLEENKKRDSVVTTASGLQYIVRKRGDGPSPDSSSVVKMHFRILDIEGKELNSSYKVNTPQQFRVRGLQLGLQEGLPMMKTGGYWKFFLPSDLALKDKGKGAVGPGAVLIYEVVLIEVMDDFESLLPKDE